MRCLSIGDLEGDSYRRVKTSAKEEIQKLQTKLSQLKAADTNFMKYFRYNLLTQLPTFYERASTAVKKKILGSIFTRKLIFEDGKYRTTGLNEVVALIGQFQKEFGLKKPNVWAFLTKRSVMCPKPESNRRPSHSVLSS